jgi:4a-hydroxytetrahydrobiopterin dehydratase
LWNAGIFSQNLKLETGNSKLSLPDLKLSFQEAMMSTVLSDAEIQQALQGLPGWTKNGNAIERTFQFGNFVESMDFVNEIAEAAEAVNHHPDIHVSYNKVTLVLVSHDSGGVTQRDVRMAGKINEIATL